MTQLALDHALRLSVAAARGRRAPLVVEGDAKRSVERARRRLTVAAGLFAFAFLVVAVRVAELALGGDVAPRTGQAWSAAATTTARADIVDRNGVLLAANLPTASLYANPEKIIDLEEAARGLASVLPGTDEAQLLKRLREGRSFVWVRRGLSPAQQAAVHALGLPGLEFLHEERRVYPQGDLLAHVLGFTDIDNQGIAGLEKTLDAELRRRALAGEGPLALGIDVRVQQVLRDEIQASIDTFKAKGGVGVVLDVKSGEVVALASLPDFNPNRPAGASQEARFNRATLGVYEMGSIFKVFTVASALDSGTVDLSGGFDASHPIRVARYTISDSHAKNRWLSVPEIFIYSSNIGSAKMALAMGGDLQQAYLRRLGLLTPVGLELPEMGQPMMPRPWREISTMTVAFGHGIAVSPLQTATAFAAVVNGGTLLQPTLLKNQSGVAPEGQRVLSQQTSDRMRALLRLVVVAGTGKAANVEGYQVGGKTGTAEKASAAGYQRNALLSSFIGAFPMDDPRYVVLVTLDEPKGTKETYGYATGGWTAAPTVSRIIARMAPLVGLAPTEPAVGADAVVPALEPELESVLAEGGATLASLTTP